MDTKDEEVKILKCFIWCLQRNKNLKSGKNLMFSMYVQLWRSSDWRHLYIILKILVYIAVTKNTEAINQAIYTVNENK